MMKVEVEFENKHDLNRFTTLLNGFHNRLLQVEYAYCCDDILYNDMAIVDSVYQQLNKVEDDEN